jgi:hypothetical protein
LSGLDFSGWEKFEGWETLNFDVFEFVSGGIGFGDDNVGVVLKNVGLNFDQVNVKKDF